MEHDSVSEGVTSASFEQRLTPTDRSTGGNESLTMSRGNRRLYDQLYWSIGRRRRTDLRLREALCVRGGAFVGDDDLVFDWLEVGASAPRCGARE